VTHCDTLETALAQSSVMAEKDCFIRAIAAAKEHLSAIGIKSVTTDANVQIRNYMRKEEKEVQHGLDVWHLNKNLQKNLLRKATRKVNKVIDEKK